MASRPLLAIIAGSHHAGPGGRWMTTSAVRERRASITLPPKIPTGGGPTTLYWAVVGCERGGRSPSLAAVGMVGQGQGAGHGDDTRGSHGRRGREDSSRSAGRRSPRSRAVRRAAAADVDEWPAPGTRSCPPLLALDQLTVAKPRRRHISRRIVVRNRLVGVRCPNCRRAARRRGAWFDVHPLDEEPDRADQVGHRSEGAAAAGLAGDDAEEDLDEMQPRAAGRGEVQGDPWVLGQPHPWKTIGDRGRTPGLAEVLFLSGLATTGRPPG
jgi:hypothetical protein